MNSTSCVTSTPRLQAPGWRRTVMFSFTSYSSNEASSNLHQHYQFSKTITTITLLSAILFFSMSSIPGKRKPASINIHNTFRLPNEIILEIIKYLDHSSLVAFTSTNHHLYKFRTKQAVRSALLVTDHDYWRTQSRSCQQCRRRPRKRLPCYHCLRMCKCWRFRDDLGVDPHWDAAFDGSRACWAHICKKCQAVCSTWMNAEVMDGEWSPGY